MYYCVPRQLQHQPCKFIFSTHKVDSMYKSYKNAGIQHSCVVNIATNEKQQLSSRNFVITHIMQICNTTETEITLCDMERQYCKPKSFQRYTLSSEGSKRKWYIYDNVFTLKITTSVPCMLLHSMQKLHFEHALTWKPKTSLKLFLYICYILKTNSRPCTPAYFIVFYSFRCSFTIIRCIVTFFFTWKTLLLLQYCNTAISKRDIRSLCCSLLY